MDPADIEAALGPEAARIARKQLGQSASTITLVKEQAFGGYAGPGLRAALSPGGGGDEGFGRRLRPSPLVEL